MQQLSLYLCFILISGCSLYDLSLDRLDNLFAKNYIQLINPKEHNMFTTKQFNLELQIKNQDFIKSISINTVNDVVPYQIIPANNIQDFYINKTIYPSYTGSFSLSNPRYPITVTVIDKSGKEIISNFILLITVP